MEGDSRTRYEAVDGLAAEVEGLMEELYQSGFDTVHDGTLRDVQRAAETAGQYGMAYLAELLSGLHEGLSMGRHRMERRTDSLAELYTRIVEYLYLCRRKAAYDRGLEYYS